MSFQRCWATSVAALFCAIISRADGAQVTYTDMLPPLSILSAPGGGSFSDLDFDYTAFLPRFDPQLGTLVSATFDTNFTITFAGSSTGSSELSLPYQTSWDGMFTMSLPSDMFYFLSLGGPFNMSSTQGASSGPLTTVPILASVSGTGFGEFAVFDVGSTANINNGFANADVRDSTMSVTYVYTPAAPEPGAIAIAVTGIAVAMLRRRRSCFYGQ